MKRLTTNKPVSEMEMNELAHNSCYIGEDYAARYRDFEKDLEARDFARKLMLDHGIWGENDSEMTDDEDFDNGIMAGLMLNPCDDLEGLAALFYRNLWAMADLYERLKKYEDLEEQGLLLKLPCKIGTMVYVIIEAYTLDDEFKQHQIMPMEFESFMKDEVGKHVFLTLEEAEAALEEMENK